MVIRERHDSDRASPAALRVRTLGAFEIEGVDLTAVRSRKTRLLLKVLALGRGRPVSVDRLLEVIWGGEPPMHPERDLSALVSRARGVVGRDAIPRNDAGYALDASWFDLDEAELLTHRAAAQLVAGAAVDAVESARAGLALLRGPLLAGEPDAPWADVERAAVARISARLRELAGQAALACGDTTGAATLAELGLEEDPYDEASLRLLMTAQTRAGRPGSALAAYATLRERLVEDLGANPSSETEALHTAIVCEEPISIMAEVVAAPNVLSPLATGLGPRATALGLAQAAEQSAARYDLVRALELVNDAIAHHDTPDARLVRGRLRVALGDFDGADDDATTAQAGGLTAHGLELRAWIARYRRDSAAAVRLGRAGAELAPDDETRASCLLVTGLALRNEGDLLAADHAVSEATRLDGLAAAGILGLIRVQQGRAPEALDLLDPGLATDLGMFHGMPAEHMLQAAAHANGMLGRPAAALALVDRLDVETDRRGTAWRYHGMAANYRSWILRSLGFLDEADDLSQIALEDANREVNAQGALDLADSALRRGDHAAADGRLEQASEILHGPVTNRYRAEQRRTVLRSRLALETGHADDALAALTALADEIEDRGDDRYRTIVALLTARARRRLGDEIDRTELTSFVSGLGQRAGVDGWSLLAEVAHDLDVPVWTEMAQRQVVEIAGAAAERSEAFTAHAAEWFDRLRGT